MLSRRSVIVIICLFVATVVSFAAPQSSVPSGEGQSALSNATAASKAIEGHDNAGGHHSAEGQITKFMLAIVLILLAAKFGGEVFERMGQPAVLGELLIGVVLGNLGLFGFNHLDPLKTDMAIGIAAQIGVILLLFQVGLESKVEEMMSVGLSSFLVAVVGVVAPMILGFIVGEIILPNEPILLHVFLGAILAATSVGITARVMRDIKRTQTREAKIILGAAVIDDVLGLIVLAVMGGLINAASSGSGQGVSPMLVISIIGKSVAFLAGSVIIGQIITPRYLHLLSKLKVKGVLMTASISICFILAALAGILGLAPIVGAFAAGLILEPAHFVHFKNRGEPDVEEIIQPVSDMFVPIFFVLMGLNVDLTSFGNVSALSLAVALTFAAIIGKMVCGLGVIEKGLNRVVVSIGMVPRGEVGLIFASQGAAWTLAGHPVVSTTTYSAVVVMVMLTTLITPSWLKSAFARNDRRRKV